MTVGPKIRVAIQLCVSLTVLGFLFSQLDWKRSLAMLQNARIDLLFLLFALYNFDRILMALKWHQLLNIIYGGVSRWVAVSTYYESSFVGFALPFGGVGPDVVRFLRLSTRGIPTHLTLSSMAVERLIGLLASLILMIVSFAVFAHIVNKPSIGLFAKGGSVATAMVVAITAFMIFHPSSGRKAMHLFRVFRVAERLRLSKYVESARIYSMHRSLLGLNLSLSILEQFVPVCAYWVGSRALGMPLSIFVCLAVVPITSVMQRIPISYAGIGVGEGSSVGLLVLLGTGYSEAMTLVMAEFTIFVLSLSPGALTFIASGQEIKPKTRLDKL